jgi:hypothetical protein
MSFTAPASAPAPAKILIKIKPKTLIDLHSYVTPQSKSSVVIGVLNQLVESIDSGLKKMIGDERKRNQFRLTQFRKAVATLQSAKVEITSGTQARQLDGIGKVSLIELTRFYELGHYQNSLLKRVKLTRKSQLLLTSQL